MPLELVIDADTHVTEPADLWTSRAPAKYADQVPRMVRDKGGRDIWLFGDRTVSVVGMTATAGWAGLVSGTVAAVGVWSLFEAGVFTLSGQGSNFIEAGVAFTVDIVVSVAISLVTEPKPVTELAGLVYSETPHAFSGDDPTSAWYRQPAKLATVALVLVVALNLIFH